MDNNISLPVLKEPETDFELKRYAKAMTGECTPLSVSIENMSGEFSGNHGTYHTTLEDCECRDHKVSRLPCKHMYRLAIELGLTNAVAETNREKIQTPKARFAERQDVVEMLCISDEKFKTKYGVANPSMDIITISFANEKKTQKPKTADDSASSKLEGLKFVITGKFKSDFLEIADLIVDNGGLLLTTVNENVSYLVVGENPMAKRIEKAQAIGVSIITEDELISMLND